MSGSNTEAFNSTFSGNACKDGFYGQGGASCPDITAIMVVMVILTVSLHVLVTHSQSWTYNELYYADQGGGSVSAPVSFRNGW